MTTGLTLLDTFRSLYNKPQFADVILTLNDSKYYLMSPVLEQYAPSLYLELESQATIPQTTPLDLTPEQLIASLNTLLNKKTLTISEPKITKEIADGVIESIYGKPMDITSSHLLGIYILSTRFGMKDLSTQCIDTFKKNIKLETLLADCQKALDENSSMKALLFSTVIDNLDIFPKEKLLDFTNKLCKTDILQLTSSDQLSCSEDLVYEIADSWFKIHLDPTIYSHIKLDCLSPHILVSHVKRNPQIDHSTYLKVLEENYIKSASYKRGGIARKNKYRFAIGAYRASYDGYHLITKKEVETSKFRELFKSEYTRLKGIRSLVNDYAVQLVCCQDYNLGATRVTCKNYLKGSHRKAYTNQFFQLETSCNLPETFFVELDTIYVTNDNANTVDDNTGLFVSNDVILE